MQVKKKVATFLGVWLFLILALLLFIYKNHEARKAEVVANCQTLLEEKTLEEKEGFFLAKYPGSKIYRPKEGASQVVIHPSGIISEGVSQFGFGLHYWNEVKIHDDPTMEGWTYASSGYDLCLIFTARQQGCDIEMKYIFYSKTSDNCAIKIIKSISPNT